MFIIIKKDCETNKKKSFIKTELVLSIELIEYMIK